MEMPVRSPSNRYVAMQSNPGRDFAIIARIFNTTTGQVSVVAAGPGAAGKFLTSTNDMVNLLEPIAEEFRLS